MGQKNKSTLIKLALAIRPNMAMFNERQRKCNKRVLKHHPAHPFCLFGCFGSGGVLSIRFKTSSPRSCSSFSLVSDMADDLQDHFERLKWVQDRIEFELLPEVHQYVDSAPYELETITNAETGWKLVYAKLAAPPSKSIQIFAGVLANETRAILDALACTLAERNGRSSDGVAFPIAVDYAGFGSARMQGMIKKLSVADQTEIAKIKPYGGGNDLLRALHDIDVIRKHRRLMFATFTHAGVSIVGGHYHPDDSFRYGKDLAAKPLIATLHPTSNPVLEIYVTVCFSEPPFVSGKPLVPILYEMTNAVEGILKIFN
jgi:hypothetical protein